MSVYTSITEMIKRYGGDITITENGSGRQARAIIQPLMYKNKMYLGGSHFPLGYYDAGHYMMTAPADIGIVDYQNTFITDRDNTYKIKRCEVVRADNRDVYIWAVLTLATEEVGDDYENTDTDT